MRAKTKKRVQNGFIYFLVFIFVITSLLLFLPIGQPAPAPSAAPLNGINAQGGDLTPEQQQMIQQQLQQQSQQQSQPAPANPAQ